MSRLIAVMSSSGMGKTSSLFPCEDTGIKGLNPKETLIVNVNEGKPLPLRGADRHYPPDKGIKEGGNYIETSDFKRIIEILDFVKDNRPDLKNMVIDDAGYLMGFDIMNKANVKDWDKWTILAAKMFSVVDKSKKLPRRDLNIIFIFHTEKGDDGKMKIKTGGKMLDNNIYLDGLFTFIFESVADKDPASNKMRYRFRVRGDGTSTVKSPVGVFESDFIPNDMSIAVKAIEEYYNPSEEQTT